MAHEPRLPFTLPFTDEIVNLTLPAGSIFIYELDEHGNETTREEAQWVPWDVEQGYHGGFKSVPVNRPYRFPRGEEYLMEAHRRLWVAQEFCVHPDMLPNG